MKSFAFNLRHIISMVLLFFAFRSTAMEEQKPSSFQEPQLKYADIYALSNPIYDASTPAGLNLYVNFLLSLSYDDLKEMVGSDDLKTDSEDSILALIIDWINVNFPAQEPKNAENRKYYFKQLVSNIRGHLLSEFSIEILPDVLKHIGIDDLPNNWCVKFNPDKTRKIMPFKVELKDVFLLDDEKILKGERSYSQAIRAHGLEIYACIRAVPKDKLKYKEKEENMLKGEVPAEELQLAYFIRCTKYYIDKNRKFHFPMRVTTKLYDGNNLVRSFAPKLIDQLITPDTCAGSTLMLPEESYEDIIKGNSPIVLNFNGVKKVFAASDIEFLKRENFPADEETPVAPY